LLAPNVQQHIDDSKHSDLLNKEKIDVLDWALANHPEFGVSTLIDQVKTFVLAGHDTASSTLAWIYYHLSQQPEVLQGLREEHDSVFGGKESTGREAEAMAKDPTILNELKYTLAVMREALRMYPPAAAVRQADSDLYVVEHSGTKYSVAGCMLWVNHWCLHRSKGASGLVYCSKTINVTPFAFIATWGEDAESFKPERWLDKEGNVVAPPLAWQPFSKDESQFY
jgi:cytochrome P450